jgi:ubiquinone/menaquinone biosynthesis C-methylase UbiE
MVCSNKIETIAKTVSMLSDPINELKAAEAFTKQSKVFDQLYSTDSIIQYKRQRVREHILKYAKAGGDMLELNCGTGEDAIFFAQHGFNVHATDISEGMLGVLKQKISATNYGQAISVEQCSFTELKFLQARQSFDHMYSNFGGLNCTSELPKVLHSLNKLVKPGGVITLVIISKFCLWESLLLFKGKFRTALRRFFADKGRKANVEGSSFKCWYYSPTFVEEHLQDQFDLLELEGLCTIVPPSYMEHFAERHPRLFSILVQKENKLKNTWPWNRSGDYFIISFRKRS